MVGRVIRAPFARLDPGVGLLVVALAFGLLTALLTLNYLQGARGTADVTDRLVVTAKTAIKPGDKIQAADLELQTVPTRDVAAGTFTATTEVVGRVAKQGIEAGSQVVATRLVDRTTEPALAFAVPEGLRAVSVPFSPVMGAGGLVVPGDHVDVLVYTEYESLFGPADTVFPEKATNHPTVVTLMQNVLVLALDKTVGPLADASGAPTRLSASETPSQARTVTLAASLQDSQLLFLAAQKGTLGLAVRRFGDETEQSVAPEFRLRSATESSSVPSSLVSPTARPATGGR
ncbi:MAG: Flp pilus assembly protein CpaB [Dehalococcoidia bacterium]